MLAKLPESQYVEAEIWVQPEVWTVPRSEVKKVCLIGPVGSGKTALCQKSVRGDALSSSIASTVASGFLSASIKASDGNVTSYEIWDTAGDIRYKNLLPMYEKSAAVCLLCISATDLDNADVVNDLRAKTAQLVDINPDAPRVLVITGMDKLTAEKPFNLAVVLSLQQELGCKTHAFTSAKTGKFQIPKSDAPLVQNGFLDYLNQKCNLRKKHQPVEIRAEAPSSEQLDKYDEYTTALILQTEQKLEQNSAMKADKAIHSYYIHEFFKRPYYMQLKQKIFDPLNEQIARLETELQHCSKSDRLALDRKLKQLKTLRSNLKNELTSFLVVALTDSNLPLEIAHKTKYQSTNEILSLLEQKVHGLNDDKGFKESASTHIKQTLALTQFNDFRHPVRGILMGMLKCLGAITGIPWLFSNYRKSMLNNPFSPTSTRELKHIHSQIQDLNTHIPKHARGKG